MACCIQQDVLRLQIPVDDVQTAMQILEAEQNLCSVETDFFDAKDFSHLHVSIQVASRKVFQAEVEVGVILESAEEFDNERTSAAGQDLSLGQNLTESSVPDLDLRL
jgi:hypothetical protein